MFRGFESLSLRQRKPKSESSWVFLHFKASKARLLLALKCKKTKQFEKLRKDFFGTHPHWDGRRRRQSTKKSVILKVSAFVSFKMQKLKQFEKLRKDFFGTHPHWDGRRRRQSTKKSVILKVSAFVSFKAPHYSFCK